GWLLAGLLLTMSLRHQFVLHDERNQCADVHIVRENLSWMNFIISVTSICFGKSLSDLILLHFVETTPSILRCS
ncbi:hypothetical protein PFISCL1PPCAC_5337, partial [Pristionchus fissidentatus]